MTARAARLRNPDQLRRAAFLMCYGSAYIARETRQIATALGLRLAFTPVRSPESNGISEAFVKTSSAIMPVSRS
jgi:putative transposase